MKNLTSTLIFTGLFLTACNNSCVFLDWNFNSSRKETYGYKMWVNCSKSQQEKAKSILEEKYTMKTDSDILNKCLKNQRYKFENDPDYANK